MERLVIHNYAVENGYHFRTALLEDGKFHIDCIDTWVYPYGQYMMDKKDILYTTLDEAVKSLGAPDVLRFCLTVRKLSLSK